MENYKNVYSIDNYIPLGRKGIVVLLDEVEKPMEVNENGVVVPLYVDYESDGGRPVAKIETKEYKNIGTIVKISNKAQANIEEEMMDIKVGDKVALYKNVVEHPSSILYFNTNSHMLVSQGYLQVDVHSLQSKVINVN
jgi:co-chaperonin GroES (HSP10)